MLDRINGVLLGAKIRTGRFVREKMETLNEKSEGANNMIEVIAIILIVLVVALFLYNVVVPKAKSGILHIGDEIDTISQW